LGAGFSKGVSSEMPLSRELSKEVVDRYKQRDTIPSDAGVISVLRAALGDWRSVPTPAK
jgi:hypothetical protein